MRLLVVSNRLPITVFEKEGRLVFKQSVGGLVSGLSAYLDSLKSSGFTKSTPKGRSMVDGDEPVIYRGDHLWVGWPGITASENLKEELKREAFERYRAYPVFLKEEDMERFYHGFCNKTVWPLFHYFLSYVNYSEPFWKKYRAVNAMFCRALMEILKPGDVVWVHDYHLMLLPKMIREKRPEIPVGFFLHIPFPSFEVFRLLPRKWSREILEGMLGANLIGFHTHDYTQYFLRSVLRIVGHPHRLGEMVVGDHIVKVETLPMGIDFRKFHEASQSLKVQKEKDKLKESLSGYKVILSVDRLDYTKGLINRLKAYEIFLENNPEWHRKVVLILVVVPSRIGVEHYQEMKRQIDEHVGRINGRFGGLDWTPAIYQNRFLTFHSLVALYSQSDVAMITPMRDGMNLIAKEYIASLKDKAGVLILSEMAGAAEELGESILVNPNNENEIAEALKTALEIPEAEQARKTRVMQERLRRYDVVKWADDFLRKLLSIQEEQKKFNVRLLGNSVRTQLIQDYRNAKKRILFFDYDGTLVPFAGDPQSVTPPEKVLNVLKNFAAMEENQVVLISGRDKKTLQNWFGGLSVGIVGEHGATYKEKNGEWMLSKSQSSDWKDRIIPVLKRYAERLAGSHLEEKEYSVVWHYRNADPELGTSLARECIDDLVSYTANIDLQVLQGNRVVEIRTAGVNKGTAALQFLAKGSFDFVLSIGDDWTDEDLFRVLPDSAYSIKVGMVHSCARFNLRDPEQVIDFLEELSAPSQARSR